MNDETINEMIIKCPVCGIEGVAKSIMKEMDILKCIVGSRSAELVCPECGRISKQQLRRSFANSSASELMTTHTCPVCGSCYDFCGKMHLAGTWASAYERYQEDSTVYYAAVHMNFSQRRQKVDVASINETRTTTVGALSSVLRQVSENKEKVLTTHSDNRKDSTTSFVKETTAQEKT